MDYFADGYTISSAIKAAELISKCLVILAGCGIFSCLFNIISSLFWRK